MTDSKVRLGDFLPLVRSSSCKLTKDEISKMLPTSVALEVAHWNKYKMSNQDAKSCNVDIEFVAQDLKNARAKFSDVKTGHCMLEIKSTIVDKNGSLENGQDQHNFNLEDLTTSAGQIVLRKILSDLIVQLQTRKLDVLNLKFSHLIPTKLFSDSDDPLSLMFGKGMFDQMDYSQSWSLLMIGDSLVLSSLWAQDMKTQFSYYLVQDVTKDAFEQLVKLVKNM